MAWQRGQGMIGKQAGAARLDPGTRVPLYQQIYVILRTRIEEGALAPGERIGGEMEICEGFGVSRITARRALNELAADGLVVRARGRGTRVADLRPERAARPLRASIDGLLENVDHIGRTTAVRVLDFGYVAAPPDIAQALGLAPGARVQRAVRVRRLGERPMSYLTTFVPEDIGALIEGKDMSRTPLLLLLEEAGVPVAEAQQTIGATVADADVALALDIPAGGPLIEVRRLVRDRDGRAVEHIRILYRPDLYRFEMTMQRVADATGRRWTAEGRPGAGNPSEPAG